MWNIHKNRRQGCFDVVNEAGIFALFGLPYIAWDPTVG